MGEHEAAVARLLGLGGWELDDAQARRAAHPDTFWMPPDADLDRLHAGSSVRLIFRLLDLADPVRDQHASYRPDGSPTLVLVHERMWLWVERVEPEAMVGVLMNLPVATHTRLVPGARVRFRKRDVIDLVLEPSSPMAEGLAVQTEAGFPVLEEAAVLAPEDPARAPSIDPRQAEVCRRVGARRERPWPFARLLVGKGLKPDSPLVYGARADPQPERGDCGSTLWSADPSLEVAAKAEGFELVEVRMLHERSPRAWTYLALPPGWAFTLGPDGYEDLYRHEE